VTQTSFKLGEYVTQDTHSTPDVLYTSREGRIYKGEVILLRNERVAREREFLEGLLSQGDLSRSPWLSLSADGFVGN
jgi:hypothetical protein